MYSDFSKILKTPPFARFTRADGDVIVEIGFGNGEYLERLSLAKPGSLVVGIEVSRWCLSKAARRALAKGIPNMRLIHGDARYLLTYAFDPASVSEVHMNFPCPWPKKRHAGRRVASSEFASVIAAALVPGGRFALATDVDWYADATRTVFGENGSFDVGSVRLNPLREFSTKYERKWLEMGRSIYTLEVVKKMNNEDNVLTAGVGLIPESPDESGEACESAREGAINPDDLPGLLEALKGDILTLSDYRVIFSDVYFGADGGALIKTISVDDGFEQHYFIRVAPSGDALRGKLETVGHPYITPGVRASLRYLTRKTGVKF